MPHHIDTSSWKSTGTEVAFKDPFSAVTTSIRKKLIFFASLAILNNYFQIDLSSSHVLGIRFIDDNVPPLSGLLSLVVFYFTITLFVYTYQEIKAWVSQSRLLEFEAHKEALDKMSTLNASSHDIIKNASQQILMNKHSDLSSDDDERLNVHQQSFINYVGNIEDSDVKFESELNKIQDKYDQSYSAYKAALLLQFIKVGAFEVLFPFGVAILAILFSYKGMISITNVIF